MLSSTSKATNFPMLSATITAARNTPCCPHDFAAYTHVKLPSFGYKKPTKNQARGLDNLEEEGREKAASFLEKRERSLVFWLEAEDRKEGLRAIFARKKSRGKAVRGAVCTPKPPIFFSFFCLLVSLLISSFGFLIFIL